ncbi:hypothetical protein ABHN11_26500 [Brevibacillus centrosporus]|uniref:hypothetical protein n=1 Tax=Brevibacillus centrosporus TaxID=54910 RepID=UPI003D1EE8DB
MKRLAVGLMAAALILNAVPMDGTFSFLTSEKKQVSPVSTGTNEDVFVTETKQIILKSKVEKRTKIKRKINADGSSSVTKDSRLAVTNGVQRVVFVPQRESLDLELANLTVTGDAAGEVTIQRVYDEKDDKAIVFEITHTYQKAYGKRKSETERGELQVTALGGFYTLKLPLTISTSYRESTDVSEEAVPSQPSQPGQPTAPPAPDSPNAPDTPASEDGSTLPAQPPSSGVETPTEPSTDPSGPAPPSSEEPGTVSPDSDQQESSPPGSPSTPKETPAGETPPL